MNIIEICGRKFANYTPHTINVVVDDISYAIPSSGIARVSVTEEAVDSLFCKNTYGDVEGLPEPSDVYYIVSGLVFGATDRKDVVQPNTGKTALRNEAGQIVGVRGFITK